MSTKSFLLGLGLITRSFKVGHIADAARVETLAQIKVWGEVEDAHDVEAADMIRQLGSTVSCALRSVKI
jgi:ATP synthase F1 complex assembly factor 2